MSNKPYIKYGRMGVKSYSVVGWTHNADVFCNECAEDMGVTNDKSADEMDESDGYPVFADDEWDYQPVCGSCHTEIPYVTVLSYEYN